MFRDNEYIDTKNAYGENSQVKRLAKIVFFNRISTISGIILLLIMFVSIFDYMKIANIQLRDTLYLNQYKAGSRLLSSCAQNYAITGNEKYFERYVKELDVDKSRENALEGLRKDGLEESELEELIRISDLSDQLVPIEKKSMTAIKNKNFLQARKYVFDSSYISVVNEISEATDEVMQKMHDRIEKRKIKLFIFAIVSANLFAIGFFILIYRNRKTILFVKTELLEPVVKVSDLMDRLVEGRLGACTDLIPDDSEMGKMIADIIRMKGSLMLIIDEISVVLEHMGRGDFAGIKIRQEYVGDYGQIKKSLMKIVSDTKQSIEIIQNVAAEVDGGANQLAQASEELATASSSQALQISDVSILVSELAYSIEYNEQEAEEAVKIANLSSSTLVMATQLMDELKEVIKELDECVQQIDDIAESDKVDKCIDRELVVRLDTTVGKMNEIIAETSDGIEDVIVGANEMVERVSRIVDKSKNEMKSIQRINDDLSVVARIVEVNSETADETAVVSEEQRNLANSMLNQINRFKF
ncbi:MAG: methyl-accepting chemotaxis protein [Lachnospiraceae bacterium]|nr:methyl-accepting chemotaxis protein [Lachnospiraceae bacterium]